MASISNITTTQVRLAADTYEEAGTQAAVVDVLVAQNVPQPDAESAAAYVAMMADAEAQS